MTQPIYPATIYGSHQCLPRGLERSAEAPIRQRSQSLDPIRPVENQRYSFDPPSTGMLAPVIQRAPSDAIKATTSATSSGLPIRFNACIPKVTSRPVSVFVKLDISVSITPGATALTRMPCGPRMAAQFLTKVSSAPLVEA